MRILYVVHQFFPKHYTGTERFTLQLAQQMQKLGHRPEVITYDRWGEPVGFRNLTSDMLIKRYNYASVPVTTLRHVEFSTRLDVLDFQVAYAFKSLGLEYDLVHIAHPLWLSSIGMVCKSLGIPLVMTLTDSWLLCPRGLMDMNYLLCDGPEAAKKCMATCGFGEEIKRRYAEAKSVFDSADELVSPSRFIPELFEKNGWIRDFKIIPHGIDYSEVKPSNRRSQPSTITFGYIGSLAWHKGTHILIDAFRTVPNRNIRLKIYGTPSDQPEYFRDLLTEARGDNRIAFLGYFNELAEAMRGISVIVIPSNYYENYPLVALSAHAYGIPVIATKVGGIPEIVKDGLNGFLYDFGDTEQLAALIKEIADDPKVIDKMKAGIVSPRRVEDEALDYENLYRELTRRKTER
jgi:glycosyltransferase involved in cell wall biosynthesis